MIKWLGGATAAVTLAFGAAAMSGQLGDDFERDEELVLEELVQLEDEALEEEPQNNARIDVDPARVAAASDDTDEVPEVAGTPEAAGAPAIRPAVATADATPQIQRASDDRFTVKRILPIDGPIKYGEWHWDTEGVPPGPIVMTVDLDARVISVFRGGYEIGAAAVLLGTDKHPTPLGTFPILFKMRHNVSEKYNNAPMPYSMFLTRSGIALHGSDVENGYASHGCVGMPDEFAAKVFAVAKKGDKVIITRGETMGMGDQIL